MQREDAGEGQLAARVVVDVAPNLPMVRADPALAPRLTWLVPLATLVVVFGLQPGLLLDLVSGSVTATTASLVRW